jgi:glutamate-1-semialdehyde 2,1-aminomutase
MIVNVACWIGYLRTKSACRDSLTSTPLDVHPLTKLDEYISDVQASYNRRMFSSRFPASSSILEHNLRYIPGGVMSLNRKVEPSICFARAIGSHMWDAEGNRYVDLHAAFGPYLLGHNHPAVNEAVMEAMHSGMSLYGSGTTEQEGELAELICNNIPWVESVQILNTGSEATAQALRLARAYTERDHVIVMQGGYNGWHNDVAWNLMTPLDQLGPRRSPGEYAKVPMSAGMPDAHRDLIHAVNFNDLDSVRFVCEQYSVAAVILEPVLQNIGIVPPQPGYLEGLRKLADEFNFVLIFDEVKTGFRHAFGGFAERSNVIPDLVVYGKAIANGFPIAALGGKRQIMDLFADSDLKRRVLLAGTYNGHPVPTAAAIETMKLLLANDGAVYDELERKGAVIENALRSIQFDASEPMIVSRIGSAFCCYFMNHLPVDWHDILEHHDFARDAAMRLEMIANGVYAFPLAVKQMSISTAHTDEDVQQIIDAMGHYLKSSQMVREVVPSA